MSEEMNKTTNSTGKMTLSRSASGPKKSFQNNLHTRKTNSLELRQNIAGSKSANIQFRRAVSNSTELIQTGLVRSKSISNHLGMSRSQELNKKKLTRSNSRNSYSLKKKLTKSNSSGTNFSLQKKLARSNSSRSNYSLRESGSQEINQQIARSLKIAPRRSLTNLDAFSKSAKVVVIIFKAKENIGFTLNGNVISHVSSGSKADKKGIKIGWILLQINGVNQPNEISVIRTLEEAKKNDNDIIIKFIPNNNTPVMVRRRSFNELTRKASGNIRFSNKKRPSPANISTGGLIIVIFKTDNFGFNIDKNVVSAVSPGTEADTAGVQPGWVILSINDAKQSEKTKSILRVLNKAKKSNTDTKISFWSQARTTETANFRTMFDKVSPRLHRKPSTIDSIHIPSRRLKRLLQSKSISGMKDIDIYNQKREEEILTSLSPLNNDRATPSSTICRNCRHESCDLCMVSFTALVWRYHCPACLKAFCKKCLTENHPANCRMRSINSPRKSYAGMNFSPKSPHQKKNARLLNLTTSKEKIDIQMPFGLLHDIQSRDPKILEYKPIKLQFEPDLIGINFHERTIYGVVKNSQAYTAGVCIGWKIIKVNDIDFKDENDIFQAINKAKKSGNKISILFQKPITRLIKFEPGVIGIDFQGNTIYKVVPGSQAEKNGIQVGWVIVEVDGQVQPNNGSIIRGAINDASKNKKSIIILFWKATTKVITFAAGKFGMRFHKNTIYEVIPNSQAYQGGVRPGWIILTINGRIPDNENEILTITNKSKKSGKLTVIRFRES